MYNSLKTGLFLNNSW